MAIIESLVAELGFKIDDTKLKQFKNNLADMKKSAVAGLSAIRGPAQALIAAFTAAATITKLVADQSDQFQKTSDRINVSTESLQKFSAAAKLAGESPEELISALDTLNKKAQDSRYGDAGAIMGFGRLGVNIRETNGELKTADKLLVSVAEKLKNVKDPTLKRKALSDLGISENLSGLLSKGGGNLQSLLSQGSEVTYFFSKKNKEDLREFNLQLTKSGSIFGALKNELGAKFAPELSKAVKLFNNLIIASKDFISQGFDQSISNLSSIFSGINSVLTITYSLLEPIGRAFYYAFVKPIADLGIVQHALGIVQHAFERLELQLEDFAYFLSGKKSAFGENLKELGDNLMLLKSQMGDLASFWADTVKNFLKLKISDMIDSSLDFISPFIKHLQSLPISGNTALLNNGPFSAKIPSFGSSLSQPITNKESKVIQNNNITINASSDEVGEKLTQQIQLSVKDILDTQNRNAVFFTGGNVDR